LIEHSFGSNPSTPPPFHNLPFRRNLWASAGYFELRSNCRSSVSVLPVPFGACTRYLSRASTSLRQATTKAAAETARIAHCLREVISPLLRYLNTSIAVDDGDDALVCPKICCVLSTCRSQYVDFRIDNALETFRQCMPSDPISGGVLPGLLPLLEGFLPLLYLGGFRVPPVLPDICSYPWRVPPSPPGVSSSPLPCPRRRCPACPF